MLSKVAIGVSWMPTVLAAAINVSRSVPANTAICRSL